MKFEHVVVINDPRNPSVTTLSREEVWFGLLCRAEDPRAFVPGLEACTIVQRSDTRLLRQLQFGSVVIEDCVTLEPMKAVTFESAPTPEHAGGRLTISIEEPTSFEMVLRFVYRTTLAEDSDDDDGAYAEFVKSAYHAADVDTVRVIRMIAESGRLQ